MAELSWLALARGTLDRMAERRQDEAWLERAWADPRTRVLAVDGGRTPVRAAGAPALVLFRPDQVEPDRERYLLGVDGGGRAYFAVPGPPPAGADGDPASLRGVGALLDDRDAGLFTHALALCNWHETHTHCPRCGERTRLASAGHVRVCPRDGSEHFPRVDPAVIMLVHDGRDRILLARNSGWPPRRVSVLAGFVESGESLEQAVAREVREEVGLVVTDLRYLGSQPWPLPRSLMLAFFARAPEGQPVRPDLDEIEEARWYTRAELRSAEASGAVLLPGSVSIARHLIDAWYAAGAGGDGAAAGSGRAAGPACPTR